MSLLCALYRIVGSMFRNLCYSSGAISKLTLAEIEVLYLDESHAWIKDK